MHRKWICIVLAVGITMLSSTAAAAAQLEGTLQVLPVWCGIPVTGGEVTLYRIGTEIPEGIQVTDGLANWLFQEGDVLSDDWMKWVLEKVGEHAVSQPVRADIGAFFQSLNEGVYLVKQTKPPEGFGELEPFLVKIPKEGHWDVVSMPAVNSLEEAPQTGDHPAPLIGAMGIGFSVAALMVLIDSRKK